MHNVTVTLKQGATTYTGKTNGTGNGDYTIAGVPNGTYTVYFSLSTPWGGVTSADVTAIIKHYTPATVPLYGIKRLAADVNGNSTSATIDASDKNDVNSKRVTPTFVFPTGDWVFTKEADVTQNPYPSSLTFTYVYANAIGSNITIVVSGADATPITQNFKSLCYGDVDASNTCVKEMESTTADFTVSDGLNLLNYPNPFDGITAISYNLPVDGKAQIDVYDLLGNKVATLFDPNELEGPHVMRFDAVSLTQGIYIYTLTLRTSDDILMQTGKMVVTK